MNLGYKQFFFWLIISTLFTSCGTTTKPSIKSNNSFYDYTLSKYEKVWEYEKEQKQDFAKELYIRGLTDYYDEKYVSAILYFETALKYEQNTTLHLMLAECYMQIRDIDNSLSHSMQVFLRDTNNTRALQLMFSGFVLKNDMEAAEKTINYIQTKDQNIDNTTILADFYSYTNPEKAIEIYDNLYFRTDDPEFRIKSLQLLTKSGNYKEAIKRSFDYLKESFVADYFENLFFSSIQDNYFEYLFKFYRELYPNYQEYEKLEAASYFLNLHDFVIENNVDVSIKNFVDDNILNILNDYNKLDIGNNNLYDLKAGFISIERGDTSLAVSFWLKELDKCDTCKALSKFTPYYCGLIGKNDIAFNILKKYYAKYPTDSSYLMFIGFQYVRVSDYNNAIIYLKKYLATDPNNIEIIGTLADCYSHLKNYKEAEKYYLQALKLEPEQPTLNNNYAYMLTNKKERLHDALRFSEIALKQEPDNGAYLDTYAWVHFKMGNYEKAKEYLEKALLSGFENSELYEHLYEVNLKLGFYNEAYKYLQKALRFEPENADYIKKLKELEKKINK